MKSLLIEINIEERFMCNAILCFGSCSLLPDIWDKNFSCCFCYLTYDETRLFLYSHWEKFVNFYKCFFLQETIQ